MIFEMCAPCLFGLEGLAADELRRMDAESVRAENGRVLFSGGYETLARANIRLSTAERVTILMGEFPARSFDELFEGVRALPWENWIPADGAFPVTGHCPDSKLHSVPDCQRIIKKAVVERLKTHHRINWFKESGSKYHIRFTILRDTASIQLDTSGDGLHKRGYRTEGNAAPLRETLAAAMVKLARYRGRDAFRDPFCGSGTIAIEAALAAKNRAPGIYRSFAAESWAGIPSAVWQAERESARSREFSGSYDICGSDIDPASITVAQRNAERAGIADLIRFEQADAAHFVPGAERGVIVTNPPYGERVMEREDAQRLYELFGRRFRQLEGWRLYLLSSHTEFERSFGRRAEKKRKLYNGSIKCDLFMY